MQSIKLKILLQKSGLVGWPQQQRSAVQFLMTKNLKIHMTNG